MNGLTLHVLISGQVNCKAKCKAKCKLCCKTFYIGNMGIVAPESHANSDKHKMKLSSSQTVNIQLLYKATNQSGNKGTLGSFVVSSAVMGAEIKWALKIVTSHFSFRSCLVINELFRSTFRLPLFGSLVIFQCAHL